MMRSHGPQQPPKPQFAPGPLGAALICACLAAMMLISIYQLLPTLQVAIAPYDRLFLSGVHDIEQINGQQARWTTGATVIRLPRPSANQPAVLMLRLLNARPAGQPVPQVLVLNNASVLADLTVDSSLSGAASIYRILVPPEANPRLELGLAVDTIQLPSDPRNLGVVLLGATVVAAGSGVQIPSLGVVLITIILTWLSYGALRGAGRSIAVALALVAFLLAGLAVCILSWPMDVLPFMPSMIAIAGLACAAIWLARWLAPPLLSEGRLVLRAGSLAIYAGLAWWAMPLYQQLITLLGAPNVDPHPATSTIGLGVGLVVLVAMLLRLLEGPPADSAPLSRAQRLLIGGLLIASLAHTTFLIWFAFQRSGPDFWIHFRAVRGFVRDGLPLYDLAGIAANHFGFSYKWPPLYVVLLRPFVAFDGLAVLFGQRVVNTLLLSATALLLVRQARSWPMAALLLMLFNFRPATDTIAFGQVDLLMLAGLSLALISSMRRRDDLAGAIIVVLSLIKIYPLLLFGLFLAQGRWRAFRGGLLAGLVCTALSIAVFGWDTHWFYLTQVSPMLGSGGGGTAWIENQTFNGWLSRFVAPQFVAEPFSSPLVSLATYLFFALCGGTAMLYALLPTNRPAEYATVLDWSSPLPLQFSLFILLMLTAVPAAWIHYHTIAILSFAVLLLRQGEHLPFGQGLALSLAYALISYGNQWSFTDSAIAEGLGVMGYSYKFYGLLILWGLTLRQLGAPAWGILTRLTVPRPHATVLVRDLSQSQ